MAARADEVIRCRAGPCVHGVMAAERRLPGGGLGCSSSVGGARPLGHRRRRFGYQPARAEEQTHGVLLIHAQLERQDRDIDELVTEVDHAVSSCIRVGIVREAPSLYAEPVVPLPEIAIRLAVQW